MTSKRILSGFRNIIASQIFLTGIAIRKNIIWVLMLLTLSCNSSEKKAVDSQDFKQQPEYLKVKKILSSNAKVVYLDSLDDNYDYGKVILLDLISHKRVMLADDSYYNVNPIFANEGERVLFASAREGDWNRLKIVKKHAQRQLYFYDFNEMELVKFFDGSEKEETQEIDRFIGLSWNNDLKEIYFSNSDNKVYSLSTEDKTIRTITVLDSGKLITKLSISNDKKYLAIEYHTNLLQKFGIYIQSLVTNKLIYNLEKEKYVKLLGWSYNNFPYIFTGEPFETDFKDNKLKKMAFNYDKDIYQLEQIEVESENSIIMLIGIKTAHPKTKIKYVTSTEIARYNFQSEKLEWLTNDGHLKSSLNAYFKN